MPGQNGRHFPDDHLKCIFLNENIWMSINISLKFVPNGRINNTPALVQVMAWRRLGDKPLSEPMMVGLLTHICVSRPQWVNDSNNSVRVNILMTMIMTVTVILIILITTTRATALIKYNIERLWQRRRDNESDIENNNNNDYDVFCESTQVVIMIMIIVILMTIRVNIRDLFFVPVYHLHLCCAETSSKYPTSRLVTSQVKKRRDSLHAYIQYNKCWVW